MSRHRRAICAVRIFVTACAQAPVGFAMDRFGARRLLAAGLLLEGAAFVLLGLAPFYGALMAVAGLANAMYHPADYSLLNASVNPRRMGRAFSFHTSAGMLGNAVAPVTMVFLVTFMDWRTALALCGGLGIAVGLLVVCNGRIPRERPGGDDGAGTAATAAGASATGAATGIRLLMSAPILLGTLFFFGMSVAGYGIQSFGVSALHLLHDAPLAKATTVLTTGRARAPPRP